MQKFKSIDLNDYELPQRHHLLTGAIAPRPIAWVSSISKEGIVNLSPFSYFNMFSTNPPVLVFSPALKGRDATVKDTLSNVKEIPEVVINVVTPKLARAMDVTSTEVPAEVNEFELAGVTELPSEKVRPPRVLESPVQMECTVKQIVPLGDKGASGNLVICEVVLMHLNEDIIKPNGIIDPTKLDFLARGGGNDYYIASALNRFQMKKDY